MMKDLSGADLGNTDIPSLLDNAVVVMIVAGALIFFIGFVGCAGAMKYESKAGKFFLKLVSLLLTWRLLPESV